MKGPDGWRYAVSTKKEKIPHHFVSGSSLCGIHKDEVEGYYGDMLGAGNPVVKYSPCRTCRRVVEMLEKKGIKPSFHYVLRPTRVV